MWKVREPFWNAAFLHCCNAYLINDLGGSSRTMKWALRACGCDSICAYVLPYHSIFLQTRLGKSGKCRLKPTQTATTSSMLCRRHGPIWPKLERHVMSCRHVATCRRHFQLRRSVEKKKEVRVKGVLKSVHLSVKGNQLGVNKYCREE